MKMVTARQKVVTKYPKAKLKKGSNVVIDLGDNAYDYNTRETVQRFVFDLHSLPVECWTHVAGALRL